MIGQTTNILLFLGPRLGLVPKSEASRLWAHQLQLTIADWVLEAHNTHHPIAGSLYYEDQKLEASRCTALFRAERLPKYLNYFEGVLKRNPKGNSFLLGKSVSYVDLSLFQMMAGLRYSFPRVMERLQPSCPKLVEIHDRVSARPRIAAYLTSERRVPFNEQGMYRYYPELDE